MAKLDLYYVSGIDVESGQYAARLYPRPDTIHLAEAFNSEYLDSDNKITAQEALTDPVRTSEKLDAIPDYDEIFEKIPSK